MVTVDNIQEKLSSLPLMHRGKVIVDIVHKNNATVCKVPSQIIPYLALTPGFSLCTDTDFNEIKTEYCMGTCDDIKFICSALLTDSIELLP